MPLNLGTELSKLVDDMHVKIEYREARLCSCVDDGSGGFDPLDDCINGFRHDSPVEYSLLRTSINMKQVSEKAATVLRGGCQITIPRFQLNHHAVLVGTVDLSEGVDLSDGASISVSIDGSDQTQINCGLKAADKTDVSVSEIVYSINEGGLGKIAYESDNLGDPNGSGYVTIKSLNSYPDSSLVFVTPVDPDGTNKVLGLNPAMYPYRFVPSRKDGQFMPIFNLISRGDIMVVMNHSRRDTVTLKRGTLDKIKAFNIDRIVSVASREINYRENIDYTFDGSNITWLAGKGPTTGDHYTSEIIAKANYIVYDEMPQTRGSDADYVPKQIHLALRNYTEAGKTLDLPIDHRLPAFNSAFANSFQVGN